MTENFARIFTGTSKSKMGKSQVKQVVWSRHFEKLVSSLVLNKNWPGV